MTAAVTKLLQKEERRLLSLFLRKTGDAQESRDLLQDLYESVLGSLDSFSVAEDQAAWLFRAAHNKVTDWYRKKSRSRETSLNEPVAEDTVLIDMLVDPYMDLENRFFRDGLLEALDLAIEALPPKLQAVIVEQSLNGRTFRELAEEWDIPQGTLLSRKREAVRLLKDALEEFTDVWNDINREL